MTFTAKDAMACERACKAERIANARFVRIDETKAESARDHMMLNRIRLAAEARSDEFDDLLRDLHAVALFNAGAWYLERPNSAL